MGSETLTRAKIAAAATLLANRDRHLAKILDAHGPPPLWGRPQGFPTLVRIILEQQVSLASAASIYQRLAAAINPFHPSGFISAGESQFRSLGVTRQKAAYLVHLAKQIDACQLNLPALRRMNDEDAKGILMNVKGIGSWSADIYLLMAMRRADIWPSGDLALASTIRELYRRKNRPGPEELTKFAERWRPFRAVAARMLWQHYLAARKRPLA